MTNYWPSNFHLEDVSTPAQILESAGYEWDVNSNGQLQLIFQESLADHNYETIIVHAKHVSSNRTKTLFSVSHRTGNPYPVRIEPTADELPNYLKKSYTTNSTASLLSSFDIKGKTITNEWVCDTPSEFRRKLSDVFNLGTLKADILSLLAGPKSLDPGDDSKGGGATVPPSK